MSTALEARREAQADLMATLPAAEMAAARGEARKYFREVLPSLRDTAGNTASRSQVTAARLLADIAGFRATGAIPEDVAREKLRRCRELFFSTLEQEIGLERAGEVWNRVGPVFADIWNRGEDG